MRQFMSNALKPEVPTASVKKPATECGGCASTGVKSAGEDIMTATARDTKEGEAEQVQQENDQDPKTTVVMSGPLGAAVTEALNKKFKKTTAGINVANEDLRHVTAAGQIFKPEEFVSRMRKSVGMVPRTDETYNTVNVMLDAAAKVDEVEFVVVNSVDAPVASSVMPTKSILFAPGVDTGLEGLAVESVQVVVTLRKTK